MPRCIPWSQTKAELEQLIATNRLISSSPSLYQRLSRARNSEDPKVRKAIAGLDARFKLIPGSKRTRAIPWAQTVQELKALLKSPKPRLSDHPGVYIRLLTACKGGDSQRAQEARAIHAEFREHNGHDCRINEVIAVAEGLKTFSALQVTKTMLPGLSSKEPRFKRRRAYVWQMLDTYPDLFTRLSRGIYTLKSAKRVKKTGWVNLLSPFLKEHLKDGPAHVSDLVVQLRQVHPEIETQRNPRCLLRSYLSTNKAFHKFGPNIFGLRSARKLHHDSFDGVTSLSANPSKEAARQLVVDEFIKTQVKGSTVRFVGMPAMGWDTEQGITATGHFSFVEHYGLNWDGQVHAKSQRRALQLSNGNKSARYQAIYGRDRDLFVSSTHVREKVGITKGIDGIWLDWMCRVTPESLKTLSVLVQDSSNLWQHTWARQSCGFLAITVCDNGQQPEDGTTLQKMQQTYHLPHFNGPLDKINQLSLFLNHCGLTQGVRFIPGRFAKYRSKNTTMLVATWAAMPADYPIKDLVLTTIDTL